MKHIKIHPLFWMVLFIVFLTDSVPAFLITYLSLVLHELVHIFFLCNQKIIVKEIIVEPFGICLKTENEAPASAIVYLSAPVFNLFLAVGSYFICQQYQLPFYRDFFLANLALGGINLIPCLPLDGGRALQLYLEKHCKAGTAEQALQWFSVSVSAFLIAMGLWIFWQTKYHFSLAVIGIFLCYYCMTQNCFTIPKTAAQICHRQKNGHLSQKMPVCKLNADWNFPAHKLIQEFRGDNYYLVHVMKNGTVLKTVTETEILHKILNTKHKVLLYECE